MNAIEFVKKHGIEAVKEVVNSTTAEETAAFESTDLDPIVSKKGATIGFNVKVHQIKYEDVKQIVDAFELVESVGGWNNATALYDESLDADLKKAIELMERCQ